MTRLESAIRRLTTQQALLDWAAREVAGRSGLILEIGLGNGRTYDHLRARLPGRDIVVFERWPAAHPDCMPPEDRLVMGDVRDTLPLFRRQAGAGSAVLVHVDIGTGDEAGNEELARQLGPLIAPLLAPDGLVLADMALDLPQCLDIAAEVGLAEARYFAYRRLRSPAP